MQRTEGKRDSGYTPIVPAVDQAGRLLMCLGENVGASLTLTEICARLGIHKSRGYTLLNTLQQFDLIERDDQTKTYRLGSGILHLARNILTGLDPGQIAVPFLSHLAQETASAAYFGLIQGDRIQIVVGRDGYRYGYTLSLGNSYHITHSAHGKAIAAFMAREKRERLLSGDDLCFYGDGEPVDMARLREELEECRKTGYAYDAGEINPGIMAISAPVFGANGDILGCIILLGAFPKTRIRSCGPKVAAAAGSISRKLGADPDSISKTLD
ncbi:MAG: IclR family transcriptional regulator [Deltaproteobacteria bacterium]|jgi:DNA-binding IclR family transcriptional regulator|nr:IclR family transcriptional regulator [Deltaproteobacteria bacterium]MDA8305723.1 IclR family transcriptional regulator [Deltaproteobacteria bacterium]